jgi:glucose-6-phosphate isomerase
MGAQAVERSYRDSLRERKAWKTLEARSKDVRGLDPRELFTSDPKRGERFTAEAVGMFLGYSKNRIPDETVKPLIQLAKESRLRTHIGAMFPREEINITAKELFGRR